MGALLFLIGLAGGFFSGLLGLGGAILMVPLLLFVPPLFGFPALDMKQVAAINIVQVFFAALSGMVVHWRNRFVHKDLVLTMGGASALAALAGGLLSDLVNARALLLLFASIATLAGVLMFLPRREEDPDATADHVRFHRPLAVAIALAVGLVGGLVGAPGAFIYVPLMMYVLKIPTRVTLGSTLAIVLFTAAFGMAGKVATGQVDWPLALALVLGSVPGAQVGGYLSKRVRAGALRWMVAMVVWGSVVQMWRQALGG